MKNNENHNRVNEVIKFLYPRTIAVISRLPLTLFHY